MTATIPDLWPQSFGEPPQPTPVAILKQQGILLGQKTGNFVFGEVESRALRGGIAFSHVFYVVAPLLAFRRPLVIALHRPDRGYPADIGPSTLETPMDYIGQLEVPTNHLGEPTMASREKVNSADEFMEALKKILQSEDTKELIQTLIAQITDPPLKQT